jgi:hypothetical protein
MWLTQLSILDFPAQVDFEACSWSKGHNPYEPPAIAAKRVATQLQPNPKPNQQSIGDAVDDAANSESPPALFFAIV